MTVSPEFEEHQADLRQLMALDRLAAQNPELHRLGIALMERMLERARRAGFREIEGAILNQLGTAYAQLPGDDHATNLKRAISYFREALPFRTAKAASKAYAATQHNLGNAYAELRVGDAVLNAEQAIGCYREALRFRTAQTAPLDYAEIQRSLGNVLLRIPSADPTADAKQAIACFREALRFHTADVHPLEYATTQRSLGNAYVALGDVENAIASYREALRFQTEDRSPLEYASIQTDLGTAYAERADGDRGANLKTAIGCYEDALRFQTAELAPDAYATTQNNLGTALVELPGGDHAAQIARGIACFREALRFRAPSHAPNEYASTQSNLGAAFAGLATGDPTANLEQAIVHYRGALEIFTPEAAPLKYARTQTNLGQAFAQLPTGDRTANLKTAIACFFEALRFRKPEAAPLDYARTQENLGTALMDISRDRESILRQAIACLSESLRFAMFDNAPAVYATTQHNLGNANARLGRRGPDASLEQSLSCYREALRVWTPETAPRDYATVQHHLGHVHAELARRRPSEGFEQAVACYREALRFRTPAAAPAGHRASSGSLGVLYFEDGDWQTAHGALASALSAGDLVYEAVATEVGRLAELAWVQDLVPDDAYCLARLDRFQAAVERLERGRTRALAEGLARDRAALSMASAGDRAAFESARERIAVLEAEGRASPEAAFLGQPPRPFGELTSELAAARRELSEIIDTIRAYVPDFMPESSSYDAIRAAATPSRPFVYLLTTVRGSLALIVTTGAPDAERHALWLDDFRSADLHELLEETDEHGAVVGGLLFAQAVEDDELLAAVLERLLTRLRDRLVGPLVAHLETLGLAEATLVPAGRLSLLPLPAAADGKLVLAVVPSASALAAAKATLASRTAQPDTLVAVGNPLPARETMRPLAYATAEVEAIAARFDSDNRQVLTEYDARWDLVLPALGGATHVHLACHGYFDVDDALESGLWVSATNRLTLRDVLSGDLDLGATRLVVLSACQSGVTEYQQTPDEAIGLPAGLIQAGIPGVVSTLWPVNDVSTAVLMAELYRLMIVDRLEPAQALTRAQAFLRSSTVELLHLARWFEDRYRASGETDADALAAVSYCHANPDARPFDGARFWAGFIFSGA